MTAEAVDRPSAAGRPPAAKRIPKLVPKREPNCVPERAPKWRPLGSSQMPRNAVLPCDFKQKTVPTATPKVRPKGTRNVPKKGAEGCQKWSELYAKAGSEVIIELKV